MLFHHEQVQLMLDRSCVDRWRRIEQPDPPLVRPNIEELNQPDRAGSSEAEGNASMTVMKYLFNRLPNRCCTAQFVEPLRSIEQKPIIEDV